MNRRKQILSFVVATFLLLAGYGWFFGFATWVMIDDWRLARENPTLTEIPKQLTDLRQSAAVGPTLSYMGYTFRTPWGEVDETKQRLLPNVAAISFKSGTALAIFGAAGISKVLQDDASSKALKAVYGNAFNSGYEFTKTELETVPGQTGLFTSKQELVRHSMFLLMKAIATPANGPIYYLQTGEMRGFQYGNPGGRLMVQLFDGPRGVEIVFPKQVNGIAVTQADVNCVIQSLRPVGPNSAEVGQ